MKSEDTTLNARKNKTDPAFKISATFKATKSIEHQERVPAWSTRAGERYGGIGREPDDRALRRQLWCLPGQPERNK
jgi:hypothetical protein